MAINLRQVEIQTTLILEIIARAALSFICLELENTAPFVRRIHADEIWMYKNPMTSEYITTNVLWVIVFVTPSVVILFHFLLRRDRNDLFQTVLSLSLALSLNGVLTSVIKIIVGRPRPDFYYRCFPDGNVDLQHVTDISEACRGEMKKIMDGRKSFPSGHSSFSFCSLGFLSLWLSGKMGVFRGYRGEGWRLIVAGTPLMVALLIALSRTCDYHHHWQDVLVGSILGLLIAYVCYRQYYPRLSSLYCHLSYHSISALAQVRTPGIGPIANGASGSLSNMEAQFEEDIKLI